MPRSIPSLVLSKDQQKQIERWLAALGTPQQIAVRCRIILAVAGGKSEVEIAAENGVNRKTVRLWRERFLTRGLQGLWEIAPGRGRKATYSSERIKTMIDATLQSKPKGSTHWSCRSMAAAQGISKSTVSNIWRSHNLKPHRTKTFKLSRDPKFLEKLTDVAGLYLSPPDRFAELTNKRIRRDSFLSVEDLIAAIEDFLAAWNESPKPFVWTATVDSILAKLARCRQTLEQIQPGCTLPKTRKRKSS